MRYYYGKDAVYIRGKFRAASTGIGGGLRDVSTILNNAVPKNFGHVNPLEFVRDILVRKGYGTDAFCLLTTAWIQNLCILQYDYITVFVIVDIPSQDTQHMRFHGINIIIISDESMSDAAILETIIIATEAKAHALESTIYKFTNTTSDAVVVAAIPGIDPKHVYAGILTDVGCRVYNAVFKGVITALNRCDGCVTHTADPSYFIFSRHGGPHWVEWVKKDCPYYPCHFKDQDCDFCYCPFYPCRDNELGEFVCSSSGGKIWTCSNCQILHKPEVAEYLKKHPDSTLDELKTKQK